jgi:hypothetical protein
MEAHGSLGVGMLILSSEKILQTSMSAYLDRRWGAAALDSEMGRGVKGRRQYLMNFHIPQVLTWLIFAVGILATAICT